MTDNNDLDNIVEYLDSFATSQESRLKFNVSKDAPYGTFDKEYHLGRCDVGSPWARGCAFDVLESEDE